MNTAIKAPISPIAGALPKADLQPLIQQNVTVQFSYGVHFTTGLFRPENPLLAQVLAGETFAGGQAPRKIAAVVDNGVDAAHPHLLKHIQAYGERYSAVLALQGQPIVLPGGEASKNNPALVEQLHQTFERAKLCRHSYVVAVGGGALLDMVGYAAATAHRGIRLIRVPTTVLAQNDSGVGVKNSVNAFGKKNFLGTFAPPYAVINDRQFLTTLDDRDWRSGMAEAVKVALVKDAGFFQWIEGAASDLAHRNTEAMQYLVYRCAQLHLDHIANSGDPFEMGSSRPLDFGHWAAHRLEHLTRYGLRHGEAVAVGMALDAAYSHLTGPLPEAELSRILGTLTALGFDLYVPELSAQLDPGHPNSIFKGLSEFQEHLGGTLTIALLNAIGHRVDVHEVDLARYGQAIALLRSHQAERRG
ncbi:MAG: 3-dehydroquinate synthase [Elainellaceae cyanobacterium]